MREGFQSPDVAKTCIYGQARCANNASTPHQVHRKNVVNCGRVMWNPVGRGKLGQSLNPLVQVKQRSCTVAEIQLVSSPQKRCLPLCHIPQLLKTAQTQAFVVWLKRAQDQFVWAQDGMRLARSGISGFDACLCLRPSGPQAH